MSTTKIGESTTNILKLLLFAINLHFIKWNQLSTYRKLNLALTSSIYFVFLPLEMQKRQTKVHNSFSLLCLKRNNPQTHKSGSCKTTFLQCICYWYNLLRWMFFILYRSSRRRWSARKGVLRNFAKFTGKCLCQSLKKRLWHRCFAVNFAKFLGTPFW